MLLSFDAGGWLRLSLLASLLHESGHIVVFVLLQHHAPRIDVTLTGFCLHTAYLCLPRRREAVLAAAGPAANLLAAVLIRTYLEKAPATLWLVGFMWANLLIGGFNLLPVPPLDGWTLVHLAFGEKLHFGRK